MSPRLLLLSLGVAIPLVVSAAFARAGDRWSDAERDEIAALELPAELAPPTDPTNRVADDPAAVRLGQRLFFDVRFSSNGKVACATCHDPAREFQDGTPLAKGVGTTGRRTMPVASTAHASWMFWDGRKDSQWSQALGPWESPVEHGGSRAQYAHLVATHYRAEYEAIFGRLPDLSRIRAHAGPVDDPAARAAWARMTTVERDRVTAVFVNMGKAVAAYERRITYGPSRFDRYAAALRGTGRAPEGILSDDEAAGLRLFVGKARCTSCHTGPLLADFAFHNTGVPQAAGLPADAGRAAGAVKVKGDEFNCRSRWSDARAACAELEFVADTGHALVRAFKTPSLRNVALRAPYMHAGQFRTLEEVIDHYDRAPTAPEGTSELRPPHLTDAERRQLITFLGALSAPLTTPDSLLRAPLQPSAP
jgi:cytochrome c peroxidase